MKKIFILFIFLMTQFSVHAGYSNSGYFFTENKGQMLDNNGNNHPELLFTGQADDYVIYLRNNGWSYVLKSIDSNSEQTQRVDIDFVNPNPEFRLESINKLPGYDNYPVRNNESINNVNSFTEIVYKEVFSGIDLRFYYDRGNLRYDYIVHPGADPNPIKMFIKNSENASLNIQNGINIPTQLGEIKKEKPFAFQLKENKQHEISCNYRLKNNILCFETGNFDSSKELIIDPVSLVYGKLKRMKSFFHGDRNNIDFRPIDFFSSPLSCKNIKRLTDNSAIVVTKNSTDVDFMEENGTKIYELGKTEDLKHVYKLAAMPVVLSKYSPEGNKEWSVYLYEKHTNLISWDANDSLIIVMSQSYFYLDTIQNEYTKDAVFISVYNMQGELLRRFEPQKPEGIEQFVHPQQDGNQWNPIINHQPSPFKNFPLYELSSHVWWKRSISYENTLQIFDERFSLIGLGKYPYNNDSTYNYGLFLQTYGFDGTLILNKELKHNKILARNRSIDFDSSNFDFTGITGDISKLKFDDDGCFSVFCAKIKNKENFKEGGELFLEFYDKEGNSVLKLRENNELSFSMGKFRLSPSISSTNYIPLPFKIDKNKNIYFVRHFKPDDEEDDSYIFYKKKIIKNPYTPEYNRKQPYLLKFDSTGKMQWITQFLSFPENYNILNRLQYGFIDTGRYNREFFQEYFTFYGTGMDYDYMIPMHTGSELILAFDSAGNVFIPRLIDSVDIRNYYVLRKLVIIKVSPEGKVLWQDTSALQLNFTFKPNSESSSVLRIKNANIVGNELYIDYFVSNFDKLTPEKDNAKLDLDEVYPIPDLSYVYGTIPWPNEREDLTYDLLMLKYNISEKDLVNVSTEEAVFDTTCVGSLSYKKIYVTNKWHSKMNFEPPLVEGEGFIISPNTAFILEPNETKEFLITFIPNQFKEYNASVIFKQNSYGNFSHTVNLKGITKAVILESDLIWDLGTILINNTASGNFWLHNIGNINSTVQEIKNLPSEFKQILPTGTFQYINSGDSLEYKFEFTPVTTGIFEYKYKIISTFACPDTFEITLRGKGVNESIIINADSINYGYSYFCEEKTDTITIENVTNTSITYNSSSVTGLNTDNFTILDKPADGTILVRGEPAKFVIRYKPLLPYGFKQAVLEINTSEINIKCPLKGEYAENEITANDIDFGFRNINVTYDTTVVIKNISKDLIQLEYAIPDDNRITVTTLLPLSIPPMGENELALEIKSATTEPVNSKLMLVFSDRCTTEIETNIVCNFDSSKVQISSIDFGKVPFCEDRADSIVISNTGKVNVKLINLEFLDNDGRFEFVQDDTYPSEIPAESTYSKLIRYLSGKKEKSVNSAKVFITLELDGVEKSYEIDINGERIIPELVYLNLIDFGELKPGEVKDIDYEISNIGEEIEIKNIQIKSPDFRVVSFDKTIQGKSKGKINLSFSSALIGVYDTEMTVFYKLGQCEDSLKIVLKSEVRRLMTIWANHDTVDAGTVGYYVPIYAKTDKGANINGTNYTLNIKYLREFYNPVTSDVSQILSKTKEGLFEQITVSGTFPVFSDSTAILFKLKGNVLFTLTKTTPIEIEYLTSEASLVVITIDGSLTLNPMCIEELRSIKSLIPTTLKVAPNPADGDLKVTVGTQEEGSFSIIIYDFQGREVAKSEFKRSNRVYEENDYKFNISGLGTGVYSVHLTAPWTLKREQLVIVK